MTLPLTGPLSFSQINVELGRASNATISLNTAEDGGYVAINQCADPKPSASNPATVSEWRGYNHLAICTSCFNITLNTMAGTGWDTPQLACDGTGSTINICVEGTYATLYAAYLDGKALYTNSSLTTLYTSNDKWFKDGLGNVFQLGTNGFIAVWQSCSALPTPTPTPTATPTATPTPTPTATPTPTPTPTPSTLYYTVTSCESPGQAFDTTITPVLASQRYVIPGMTPTYWIYDNNAATTFPQNTVNGSLQIVSGQSGCP